MKNHKILIVEDSEETALGLNEFFNDEGFASEVATSGKEALSKFKKQRPQLIITDYNLPDINGITLVKQCQAISPALKVIYITGVDIFRQNPGFNPGAHCKVVEKPIRPREILKLVKKILELT